MPIEVEAIYENGVLKPDCPLPLQERERVRITVSSASSRTRQSQGLVRWTGKPEVIEQAALDPSLDPLESA